MQLKMLIDFLNELNPLNQSGFQLGPTRLYENKIVTGIVLTLNPDIYVANFARKMKSNFILCIHPLLSSNLQQIDEILSKILFILIRNRIWLYYMSSPSMVSDTIANIFNLITDSVILSNKDEKLETPLKIYTLNNKEQKIDDFLYEIKRKLNLNTYRYILARKPSLNKIGLALNNDISENSIKLLYNHGCSCVITENLNYFQMVIAKRLDMSVIELPYKSIYFPWIQKLTKIISLKFPRLNVDYFNSDEIISTYR